MSGSAAQKLSIVFVIEYEKQAPQQVCGILTRTDGTWRGGDVRSAKHSPKAAANQVAALFALFELMRRGRITGYQLDKEKFQTVSNMGDKLLRFQGPSALLKLPCFLPDNVTEEEAQEYVEARRLERKSSASLPPHPFFSKWYRKSGSIALNPDYQRPDDGDIIFINAKGLDLRGVEERLLVSDINDLRIKSVAGLRSIVRQFSKRTRPVSGVAATASHKSRSRKSPDQPSKSWEESYLARLTRQLDATTVPWYVDPLALPREKPGPVADPALPMLSRSARNYAPVSTSTALRALRSGNRVVLLGDPGTGKTTALVQYSVALVEERSKERGCPLLPIVIDLTQKDENPEDLVKSALRTPFDECLPDFAESKMSFTVLFDGIDQLSSDMIRSEFIQKALALFGHNGIGQVVLTCKSSDWLDTYAKGIDLAVYEIGQFGDEPGGEIEACVRRRFHDDGGQVLTWLRADEQRLSMARNPQLLGFLCDVFDVDGCTGHVSEQRSSLIAAWIRTKLQLQDHPNAFWYSQFESVLSDIAFQMTQAGVLDVGTQADCGDDVHDDCVPPPF